MINKTTIETKYNNIMINILATIIRARLWRQNKNWLGIITGETGSGKSYCAMALGEDIDKGFNIDNVVFSARGLIELLNSNKIKRGSCIVFDEAGVGLPKREWYSISNKLVNYILQTFRHQNLAVIFTTPSFDFVDVDARKLFHTYIQTMRIDYKKEIVYTKLFTIQYNPRYGKIYAKYFRMNGVKVNPYCIGKPSAKLIKQYEIKKKEFTTSLKKDAEVIIREIENSKKEIPKSNEDIVNEILKNKTYIEFIRERGKKKFIDIDLLRNKYKLSQRRAPMIKKLVEQQLYKKNLL